MTGWIIAAVVYALGTLVVFRLSNDPMHRMMSPIWPVTLIFLLLTIRK